MELDENKTLFVYKRNLDGFEIRFDSGYELFNENPDYEFNLNLAGNFQLDLRQIISGDLIE